MLHRVATTGLSLLSLSLGVVLSLTSIGAAAPNPAAAENQLKNKQSTIASAEALKASLANLSGAIKAATEAEIAAKLAQADAMQKTSEAYAQGDPGAIKAALDNLNAANDDARRANEATAARKAQVGVNDAKANEAYTRSANDETRDELQTLLAARQAADTAWDKVAVLCGQKVSLEEIEQAKDLAIDAGYNVQIGQRRYQMANEIGLRRLRAAKLVDGGKLIAQLDELTKQQDAILAALRAQFDIALQDRKAARAFTAALKSYDEGARGVK